MDISDAHTGELLSACYEYPRMNTDMFANFLEFVAEFVNPDQKDLKIQISNKYNLFDVKDSKDLDTDEENSALEIENQMMDMIKYGKIDELRQFLQTSIPMRSLSLPMLTPSTIRSAKNILIASSSLASRVAVSQGVDYDTAVSLSDYYIHRVESLNNYNDIIALISTMQLDYTTRIATVLHPHSESYLINQIYDYVASHLHERISTKDVADALSMNGSYLTKIFRQETGQSIMEYIHKQKIREACYLLESSNLNYVVIADKLGYSSQQHFQKVFKSVMNMTPGKYRSLNSDHDIV
ncbi:MAG: AraC family transcriptional regulator [Eubacteriales bacterium]|nr:AraC family transcriptional regulator [Eubacteriales bacterium]